MNRKNILMLITTLGGLSALNAQSIGPSVLNASGASVVLAGKTFEYSLGQPFEHAAVSTGNYLITPGVLQPEFSSQTGIEDKHLSTEEVQLFPNPATDMVWLQPAFKTAGTLQLTLTDVLGRTLSGKEIHLLTGAEKQAIPMRALAVGSYYLAVSWTSGNTTKRSSFKIEKTN